MKLTQCKALLAAAALAAGAGVNGQTGQTGQTEQTASTTSSAQLARGGTPTGHRHKLQPVPPRPRPEPTGNSPQFGDAVLGASAAEQAVFAAGREEFESVETTEGGLGPIFNNNSCAACHSTPVSGGVSGVTVTRFGRWSPGHFDPLAGEGGSLLQQFATDPSAVEHVPPDANVVAKRLTTPLFGAGLVEAISDNTIRLNAWRWKPDGVRGHAAQIIDPASGKTRVGRFGWKAQHASLLGFAGDAYFNEMGVTSRLFPAENAPNGNQALLEKVLTTTGINDPVNPLTGRSDIDAAADFMRLLGAPPTLQLTASALAGQRTFDQIKCTACHMPTLTSGPSSIRALAYQTVPLYSDLLLHNMGRLGDGIEQGAAHGNEIKTAPLWGLRVRGRFLHDGRASNVRDAVLAHDGEASVSRERFRRLSDTDAKALLEFLGSI